MDNISSRDQVLGYGERDHTADTDTSKTVTTQAEFEVEFGSGWYHDTAIVEAEQSRPRLHQSNR